MNDRQLVDFFKKPAGSVCGRFHQDQLEREITIPRKRIPWIKYFFHFALPAFLLSAKASAQGKVSSIICSKSTSTKEPINYRDTLKPKAMIADIDKTLSGTLGMVAVNPFKNITGKVTDEKGFPIPHASVIIKGTTIGMACDDTGNFKLDVANRKNTILIISAIGFKTEEIILSNQSILNIQLAIENTVLSGAVVVIAGRVNVNKLPSKIKQDQILVSEKPQGSVLHGIRLFPNPSFTNGQINIQWIDAEKGDYDVYFVNETGQQVHKTELVVLMDKKTITSGFFLPALKNGIYFVTITNKKTKKRYTEKLLVENKTF